MRSPAEHTANNNGGVCIVFIPHEREAVLICLGENCETFY